MQAELDEIAQFVSVLETAIPERNKEVIALTVDVVGNEWRELGESFPAAKDTSVAAVLAERRRARGAAKRHGVDAAAHCHGGGRRRLRRRGASLCRIPQQVAPAAAELKLAEPWSLFNPAVREAHFEALRQLAELAK